MGESLISYETLVHAISGACGSSAAMAIVLPLDTARTRLVLDVDRKSKSTMAVIMDLVREEGILTLFRGGASTVQSAAASNFVYFYTFHGLKRSLVGSGTQSASKDLLFACLAGAANILVTNPLWVVNSRLKMQGTEGEETKPIYKGLIDGLVQIGRQEGIKRLWDGTVASLVLVSNPAIKFTAYEYLKRIFLSHDNGQLSAGKAFLMGAFASALATVVTYPVQVVQTRARFGHDFHDLRKGATMIQLAAYMVKNFGPSYLYKGLEAKLIQSIVAAGFMFLTYEKIAKMIFTAFGIAKRKH